MPARPKTSHLYVVEDRGHTTACHVWTRAINSSGYGVRTVGGVAKLAHRHAYETEVGPIPDGLTLDHLCRVTACVNPAHLEPVTGVENIRRGSRTRLTEADVAVIRAARLAGVTTVELGARFGVHPSWISRIAGGRSANRNGGNDAWRIAA